MKDEQAIYSKNQKQRDEKDFDFAIVVLRDGTHIVKEEDDRSDRNGV